MKTRLLNNSDSVEELHEFETVAHEAIPSGHISIVSEDKNRSTLLAHDDKVVHNFLSHPSSFRYVTTREIQSPGVPVKKKLKRFDKKNQPKDITPCTSLGVYDNKEVPSNHREFSGFLSSDKFTSTLAFSLNLRQLILENFYFTETDVHLLSAALLNNKRLTSLSLLDILINFRQKKLFNELVSIFAIPSLEEINYRLLEGDTEESFKKFIDIISPAERPLKTLSVRLPAADYVEEDPSTYSKVPDAPLKMFIPIITANKPSLTSLTVESLDSAINMASYIGKALAHNTCLTSLTLSSLRAESKQLLPLAKAISTHPSLVNFEIRDDAAYELVYDQNHRPRPERRRGLGQIVHGLICNSNILFASLDVDLEGFQEERGSVYLQEIIEGRIMWRTLSFHIGFLRANLGVMKDTEKQHFAQMAMIKILGFLSPNIMLQNNKLAPLCQTTYVKNELFKEERNSVFWRLWAPLLAFIKSNRKYSNVGIPSQFLENLAQHLKLYLPTEVTFNDRQRRVYYNFDRYKFFKNEVLSVAPAVSQEDREKKSSHKRKVY